MIDRLKKELKQYSNDEQLIISWTVLDKILNKYKDIEQYQIKEIIEELSKKD